VEEKKDFDIIGMLLTTLTMGAVSVITFLISSYFGNFASKAETPNKIDYDSYRASTLMELSTIKSEVGTLREWQKEMREDIKYLVREERKRQ